MLTMRIFFVLAACLLTISISSSNSYPQPQAKAENTPTTQDKRGTQESPLIIKGDITTKASEKPESERQQEEVKIEIERSIAKYAGWTTGITLVLVLVTGALAFVTYGLWTSTNKLVVSADITGKHELRAYVGCSHIELDCPNLTNQHYAPPTIGSGGVIIYTDVIRLTITNYGKTPATKVRTIINWAATQLGQRLPLNFPYADVDQEIVAKTGTVHSKRTLFPSQTASDAVAIADLRVFQQAHQQLCWLYLHGHIDYRDSFDQDRTTTFCFMYEPWRPEGDRFTPHDQHNDAN